MPTRVGGTAATGDFKLVPIKTGKKKGRSVGGFIGNVADEAIDITTGAIPGIKNTAGAVAGDVAQAVEDTVRVVTGKDPPRRITKKRKPGGRTAALGAAIGRSYADYYGPLFSGDFDEFLENVYEQPLSFTLDAATVGSLGLTGAVKVGVISQKAGKVLELTDAAGNVSRTKVLSRGELRARLQSMGAKARNREVRIGDRVVRPEGTYVAKQEAKRLGVKSANLKAQNAAFNRSILKLRGQPVKIAAFLAGRFDRQALDSYMDLLREEAKRNPDGPATPALKAIENPRVQRLFDNPNAKVQKVLDEGRVLGERQRIVLNIDEATAEAARFRPARIAQGARFDPELGDFVGGPSIDDLKARGLDPIYFPDVPSARAMSPQFEGRGGGLGIPNRSGHTRQNTGALQLAGQMVMDPSVLNQSFLNAAKFQHYSDSHDTLLGMAREADYIPKGYSAVREKRSDRVSAMDRTRGEFDEWVNTHLDDKGDWISGDNGLVTKGQGAARTAEGKYLVVPDKVVKQITGEFTKASNFTRMMNAGPMKVWRALVLGLRPAYLVNNMLGNTMLYIMHSGNPEAVRQLGGAFKQFVKPSEHAEIDRLLEKHFGAQTQGGFVATQYPDIGKGNRVMRGVDKVAGVIPGIDRRWEQALRRAKVIQEIKRHPGLKEIAQRMGKETDAFEKLSKKLDENPDISFQIHQYVNDALGNYENLTAFEKGAVRNLFPFYAWYRAIAGVSLGLVLEQPLKVNVLANLGDLAIAEQYAAMGLDRDDLPASLRGFLVTGIDPDGRVRGLNTGPTNPYATVGQLADFVAAAASLKPGEMGRTLPGGNPLITDLVNQIWGQTPTGYEVAGIGTIETLPFVRLLKALEAQGLVDVPWLGPASTRDPLYDHDIRDELARYGGIPHARISKTAAKRMMADRDR